MSSTVAASHLPVVVAAGGVVPACRAVRAARPDLRVEVEVTEPDLSAVDP